VHTQQHGVRGCANSNMHMWARAASACGVLENLVLVAGVHDNDRLQLPCFDDLASLETQAMRVCSRSKIVSMRACATAACATSNATSVGAQQQQVYAGVCSSRRGQARASRQRLTSRRPDARHADYIWSKHILGPNKLLFS
jgi:hypothetical protein